MPPFDLQPTFLSADDAGQIASRQVLLFLALSDASARWSGGERRRFIVPGLSLFSLKALREDALTNQPPLFRWRVRPIYDVDGRLLFYDHTIPLRSNNELCVRTGASELLGTPVWSVRTGRAINFEGLIGKAVSVARETPDLEPVLVGTETSPRLVCYGYPRLGIICSSRTRPSQKFVIDLWDLSVVLSLNSVKPYLPEESPRTIWSPYDLVSAITFARLRARWQRNLMFLRQLPELPERVDDLPGVIVAAGGSIQEAMTTDPSLELEGQATPSYCAAATASMILKHYDITNWSQFQIASAMDTTDDGATPDDQREAIPSLGYSRLVAELDTSTSFGEGQYEIQQNRPFKTGNGSHARACGGFLIEGSGKEWLYIFDPLPTGIGHTYFEAWDAAQNADYMYVRPV